MRQETDAAGNVLTTRSFDPHGVPLQGNGGAPFGYTGEQTDNTGLVFLRARYMQPGLGVFLSHDPWSRNTQRPGSLNGWNYVEGNPVNLVDPTGKWICTLDSLAFNPHCYQWVGDALDKLKNQGGEPGKRLVTFFHSHDVETIVSGLECMVFPPGAGYLLGIKVSFNPNIPRVLGGLMMTIAPDHILIDSTSVTGATPTLEEAAIFGHEISHLAQAEDNKYFSIQSEMLSYMLMYRLENELGVRPHHPRGEEIRIGRGNPAFPQPYNPWDNSDLEAFKAQLLAPFYYPLRPFQGDLPRNWLDQWGAKNWLGVGIALP